MNRKKRKNPRQGSMLLLVTLMMIVASIYVTTSLFDVRGTVDQERLYKTTKQLSYLQLSTQDFRLNNPTVNMSLVNNIVSPYGLSNLVSANGIAACTLTYTNSFTSMQNTKNWCGPYIDTSLFLGSSTEYAKDAWGTALVLTRAVSASGGYTYTITSWGENLANDGGVGDDIVEGPF